MMKAHLWGKTNTYLIILGISISILLLELLVITILDKMNKGTYINDNIAESIFFFVCFPGIIVGLTGALICTYRKK